MRRLIPFVFLCSPLFSAQIFASPRTKAFKLNCLLALQASARQTEDPLELPVLRNFLLDFTPNFKSFIGVDQVALKATWDLLYVRTFDIEMVGSQKINLRAELIKILNRDPKIDSSPAPTGEKILKVYGMKGFQIFHLLQYPQIDILGGIPADTLTQLSQAAAELMRSYPSIVSVKKNADAAVISKAFGLENTGPIFSEAGKPAKMSLSPLKLVQLFALSTYSSVTSIFLKPHIPKNFRIRDLNAGAKESSDRLASENTSEDFGAFIDWQADQRGRTDDEFSQ